MSDTVDMTECDVTTLDICNVLAGNENYEKYIKLQKLCIEISTSRGCKAWLFADFRGKLVRRNCFVVN